MRDNHPQAGKLAQATISEWTWKTDAMKRMTLDVCRTALDLEEFSALDLKRRGAEDQGGSGIAGSVIRTLCDRGVIAKVGVYVGGAFYPKTVINDGGNPINVYRLANRHLAEQLIERHSPPRPADIEREAIQEELFA
jgi:hypothetical protein